MPVDTARAPDLSFDDLDPRYRAFIADYIGLYGLDADAFCRPLPGADEMFFKAILPNYEQDASIAAFKFTEATLRHYDTVRQIVDGAFGGFEKLGSFLDFASGYGRLTRIMLQKLRPDQIHVADIYKDAVDWQRQAFGVAGTYSTPDPAELRHQARHDLVFVGSLFSHLPADLFHRWLATLHGLLKPGGVLAFSVHDESFLPEGEAMDASGIRYFRFSESGSLDADIYGMSYVSEAFVADAVARLPGRPSWRRFHKGAYENQDLYVVGAPGKDVSGVFVASTPMGGFETAAGLTNGAVEFSGWALERTPGKRLTRLSVQAGARTLLEVSPHCERPDVLTHFPKAANAPIGWRFRLGPDLVRPGEVIRLRMDSDSGLFGCAYAEFPPPVAMTYAGWSRRALRRGEHA